MLKCLLDIVRDIMDVNSDNDPTCVIKMLDEFRSSNALDRRNRPSIWLTDVPNKFSWGETFSSNVQSIAKPMKLNFDDSNLQSNDSNPTKKVKIGNESMESDTSKISDSSVLASPWESRHVKAELAEARAQIHALETRINQMHAVRRETELLFEQEKKSLQQTVERDRNTIRELEQRLKTVRKREVDTREELAQCRSQFRQDKCNLETKIQELQFETAALKDKISEITSENDDKCGSTERQLATMEAEMCSLKEQLAAAKGRVEDLTVELREQRRELRQWETDKTKLLAATQKVKELEYERESHLEAISLAQTQQNKLMRVSELEREITSLKEENKNLRQATSNTLYLEGIIEDLHAKLVSLEERERECINLQVELGMARTRLDEWAALARQVLDSSSPGALSPMALRRYIESLQQRELQLSTDKAQIDSNFRKLSDMHGEMQKEAESMKVQIARLKATVEQHANTIRRMHKKNSLIVWERNDLRNLVDSCQKEMTITSASGVEAQQNSRMEALEKLVDGYRKRMEQIEADPCLAAVEIPGVGSPQMSEKLDKVTAEKNSLLKEKENLEKQLEELRIQMEYRALKGDFDVRDCKVLHFKMNPTSEAAEKHKDELLNCQEEVLRLRERVRLLEEGQTHDLTQAVNERVTGNTSKEIEDLKERIKSHERQNQRLKEVFKTASHEFREAVYTLLGYKVDGLPNKIYRLSNMYAEAPDEHLLFKLSQTGDMELLETPFSSNLTELIDLHLHHHRSIPVFLSAITIDLFQRQTLCSNQTS